MKSFSYSFEYLPPVTKRGSQVLIAIFSESLKSLYLSRKNIYPEGIFRLFGGGIEYGEDPLQTAPRELMEETLIKAESKDFSKIEQFKYDLSETSTGKKFIFNIHLYSFIVPDGITITPSDDVDIFKEFNQSELASLIEKYQNLSTKINTAMNGGPFSWSDYSKIFSPVHQSVLDYWKAN